MPPGFHRIGAIERRVDGVSKLVDLEWISLIGSRSDLVTGPRLYGRNPATGESIELRRGVTCRGVAGNVGLIGYFDFDFYGYTDSKDGSAYGSVVVGSAAGVETAISELATSFAAILNASFYPCVE